MTHDETRLWILPFLLFPMGRILPVGFFKYLLRYTYPKDRDNVYSIPRFERKGIKREYRGIHPEADPKLRKDCRMGDTGGREGGRGRKG